MSRTRRWTAVGIVGVLALALGGLLWRNSNTAAPTPTSTSSFQAIVTTTNTPSTTATTVVSPTTTSAEQRVAEVEAILSDLWFGWFDAIYRDDPAALWDIVATTRYHESGIAAMEALTFTAEPTNEQTVVATSEVLLDRPDCLVALSSITAGFIEGAPTSEQVNVLWWDDDRQWRFATSWRYTGDLWQADCDELVRETTP